MDRRNAVLGLVAIGAFASPIKGLSQSIEKVRRIGLLWTSNPEPRYLEAFRQGLRELGYVEGKNLTIEQKSAANAISALGPLADGLVASRVAVIITQGTPAAKAAGAATATIPIVVALGDPVGAGLADSLGKPGRNVTGLTLLTELGAKRLELLKDMIPGISRVAALVDATNTDPKGALIGEPQNWTLAAKAMGLQLQMLPIRSADEFEQAFVKATQQRAQGLLISPSPILSFHNKVLVELAAKHRLPAIFGNPEAVNLGGLMSYGPSYAALFRRATSYLDKILKGAKPGDLPIEQSTTFELVINGNTAKALGLKISRSLLISADKVIE